MYALCEMFDTSSLIPEYGFMVQNDLEKISY